jgi:ribosomal-protein-alanine N-acetyltransferase
VRIEDEAQRQASFGCAIARSYWGAGYAYEASFALIDYSFTSLPIERTFAETIAENANARALAERLGMKLEEEFKQVKFFHSRGWDVGIYAISKNEWHNS